MGYPAHHSARTRFVRRLPGVAAPIALAGVAAGFALGHAPAAAAPAAAQAPAHHAAAVTAVRHSGTTAARLVSVTRQHSPARPAKYTVKSGDTLSAIAQRLYGNPAYWPAIYWDNHSQIRYANVIQVGQVLAIPAKPATIPAAPSELSAPAPAPAAAPAPAPAPVSTTSDEHTYSSESESTRTSDAASEQPAPAGYQHSAPTRTASTYSGASGSFQSCVIARESGGNSQVMNGSGHYGLYQFSASTWAAYGGNPADFGNASVAEQNQVFDNAIAAGGQSAWAPYDGC
ncbi:MAG TPA: transglycosylase family protein [Trebonia sp.]|nr:transglycosylase family protein [Trebonia sp.]